MSTTKFTPQHFTMDITTCSTVWGDKPSHNIIVIMKSIGQDGPLVALPRLWRGHFVRNPFARKPISCH